MKDHLIALDSLTLEGLPGLLPGFTLVPLDILSAIVPWRGTLTETIHNDLLTDVLFEFYPFRHFYNQKRLHSALG